MNETGRVLEEKVKQNSEHTTILSRNSARETDKNKGKGTLMIQTRFEPSTSLSTALLLQCPR